MFGHPKGLMTLFFTEFWERFSFYGMRGLLIVYMVTSPELGGLGFDTAYAAGVYGFYLGAVYILGLPGGFVADRYWGQRKAVMVGGIIIALGHGVLAIPTIPAFYISLGLLIIGTGLLKPNISVMVGGLYKKGDPRRDGGFIIFYMGINLGAFLAPLIVGYVAQQPEFVAFMNSIGINISYGWHFAFGIAAIGMLIGLYQYKVGGKNLGDVGLKPSNPVKKVKTEKVPYSEDDKKRLVVIGVLLVACALFFSAFEQAGSSLNLFALNNTENTLWGFDFPSTWFQAQNALFILMFGPVFSWLWVKLHSIGREPSGTTKFVLGLTGVGVGFAFLWVASALFPGEKVGPMWLTMVYLFHTLGELCLSPVGLSLMTKLAPDQIKSSIMGMWFVAVGFGGGFIGGVVAMFYDPSSGQETLFSFITIYCLVSALLLSFLIKPIRNMLPKEKEEDKVSVKKEETEMETV